MARNNQDSKRITPGQILHTKMSITLPHLHRSQAIGIADGGSTAKVSQGGDIDHVRCDSIHGLPVLLVCHSAVAHPLPDSGALLPQQLRRTCQLLLSDCLKGRSCTRLPSLLLPAGRPKQTLERGKIHYLIGRILRKQFRQHAKFCVHASVSATFTEPNKKHESIASQATTDHEGSRGGSCCTGVNLKRLLYKDSSEISPGSTRASTKPRMCS